MRATSSTRGRTRRWTWAAASAVALTSVASVAPVSAAYADPGIGTNLGQVTLSAAQFVQEAAPPTGAQFARVQAQAPRPATSAYDGSCRGHAKELCGNA